VVKRFLAFAGECYSPKGGFADLVGDFHTVEAATDAAEQAAKSRRFMESSGTWWHVADTEARAIIAAGK
jgi:hypothetical protein